MLHSFFLLSNCTKWDLDECICMYKLILITHEKSDIQVLRYKLFLFLLRFVIQIEINKIEVVWWMDSMKLSNDALSYITEGRVLYKMSSTIKTWFSDKTKFMLMICHFRM